GVHYIIFFLFLLRTGAAGRRSSTGFLRGRLVHRFGQFVARCGEFVGSGVELDGIVLVHRLLGLRESVLNVLGVFIADLVAMFLQRLFDVVNHRVGAVAGLDLVALLAIVGGVGLRVLGHLLDFILGQTRRRGDGDLLLVIGRPVLGRHVQDAV